MTDVASAARPIVVTGAGGWVGSAFLATIAAQRGPRWAGSVRLFGSRERTIEAPDGSTLPVRQLADIESADVDGAYVVHLAYLTKEKAESQDLASFMEANLRIDEFVLHAASGATPAGLFVASSGAARLAELGVDRHAYGMAKLLQEDSFADFAQRSRVPTLIGRIYNLAGPYINKIDSYALSSFLAQAFAGGPIRIAAAVPVYRSFLHVADLASLALRAIACGRLHHAPVDFCGSRVLEMGEIALAAARAAGRDGGAIERPPVDLSRPSSYLGDATHTLTLALECGLTLKDFEAQVEDTGRYLQQRSFALAQPGCER